MAVDYAARFNSWGSSLRSVYEQALERLGPKVDDNQAQFTKAGEDYARTMFAYQRQVCRLATTYMRVQALPLTPDVMRARQQLSKELDAHVERMRDYMTGFVAGSPTHGGAGIAIKCEDVGVLPVLVVVVAGLTISVVVGGICWAVATIKNANADVEVAKLSADSWDEYYAAKKANPSANLEPPKSDGKRAVPEGPTDYIGGMAKAAVGLIVVGGVVGIAYQMSKKS